MKLIGKSFLVLGILTVLAGCGGNGGPGQSTTSVPPTEISFSGIGLVGIFDPSTTYDPATGRLWMSYSYVEPSVYFSSDQHLGVGLRLAYSDDGGTSWTDAGVVVSAFTDTAVGPLPSEDPALNLPANSHGTWQSETSSLVYDPNAPAAERWKIIWHQYLKANGTSYFVDYGWIALKMAASPQDLATAPAVKLFSGKYIKSAGENTNAPAYAPIAGPAHIALDADITNTINSLDPAELSQCVWAEPGLLADTNGLHLIINCQYLTGTGVDAYVVMFRCDTPCNITQAGNWTYIGRVLTPVHASQIGFRNYSAPELIQKGVTYYLLVTPVRDTADSAYEGCRLYQFADFANATLLQNAGGFVEVLRYDGITNVHNGACSAHAQMTAGLLHSQFRSDVPPVLFHMLQTHVTTP